jgi:hypothetical protein
MVEEREEHKMFLSFDLLTPLLGMQPKEIHSAGEISFMCKSVHCNIIYD